MIRIDEERADRCLTCGYIIEGLSESKCPECGCEFDSCNPQTFKSAGAPKQGGGTIALVLSGLAWGAVGIVIVQLKLGMSPTNWPSASTLLGVMGILVHMIAMAAAVVSAGRQRYGVWLLHAKLAYASSGSFFVILLVALYGMILRTTCI